MSFHDKGGRGIRYKAIVNDKGGEGERGLAEK